MTSQTVCGVRGCCWRGECPTHGPNVREHFPGLTDHLITQRPDQTSRGGGKQVQCRCGRWVDLTNARGHLFTCDGTGDG